MCLTCLLKSFNIYSIMKNQLFTFFMAVAVASLSFFANARTVEIAKINRVDGFADSLDLALGTTSETNTLFVAYDVVDKGEDIAAWSNVDLICVVSPATNSITYTLPDGWGESITALRFFLADGVYLPYDYELEYLITDGKQCCKISKRTFKYLETKFVQVGPVKLANGRVFLAGIHSSCWYDLKYATDTTAKTYGGIIINVDTPFVFAITNINNDAKVYIDGKSSGGIGGGAASYRYNILNGVSDFYLCGTPNNQPMAGHMYGVKIFNDGKQIANFIPCMKGGVAYFYDTLNKAFVSMSGAKAGTTVGYVRDKDERVITSYSSAYKSEILMSVLSNMKEPTGMEPMPGNYAGDGVYTAPSISEVDNIRYTCKGYTLEELTANGWQVVGTFQNLSYVYPNDDTARRLTWKWELTHYKVDFKSYPESNGSTVLTPDIEDGYYPAGSTLVLTPKPNSGAYHTGYYVVSDKEVVSGSEYTLRRAYPEGELALTIECPKVITSYYAGNWGVVGSSITNGVWDLTFKSISQEGIRITGYKAGYGMLDFRNLERDTGLKVLSCAQFMGEESYYRSPTSIYAPDLYEVYSRAFHSFYSLTHFELSSNLTFIGACTFYNNHNLTNISPKVFPKVSSIGDQSFDQCSKLTGDYEFLACKKLESKYSFSSVKITSIKLPACIDVCRSAFVNCTKLTNVVIYATTLGDSVFSGASSLKTISFTNPKGLSTLPASVFNGANALTDIWYYGTNAPASIGGSVFNVSSPYPSIHVRNNNDIEGWEALANRVAVTSDPTKALTASDKARADYPGRRTIGFISSSSSKNYAWIVKWPVDITTFFMVR